MAMSLKSAADRLGEIKALKDTLSKEEEALKEFIKASGKEEVDGKLFRVKITVSEVRSVDYKGLVEKLNPAKALLRKFTEMKKRIQVLVTARNSK